VRSKEGQFLEENFMLKKKKKCEREEEEEGQ
jgi:hypothetical protein